MKNYCWYRNCCRKGLLHVLSKMFYADAAFNIPGTRSSTLPKNDTPAAPFCRAYCMPCLISSSFLITAVQITGKGSCKLFLGRCMLKGTGIISFGKRVG